MRAEESFDARHCFRDIARHGGVGEVSAGHPAVQHLWELLHRAITAANRLQQRAMALGAGLGLGGVVARLHEQRRAAKNAACRHSVRALYVGVEKAQC